jgi:DNA polymerase-3 subunit delta'
MYISFGSTITAVFFPFMFIGNQPLLKFFDTAQTSDNLSHAYCLVGPSQVGKRTLANFWAAKLLNVAEDKLITHPDYCCLAREFDDKTGKLKKEISIRQARALTARLGGRAWLGGYQIIILDEAELLSDEAANALLKLLEESATKRIFFLLADDEQSLLATIKSRCQILNLLTVPELELRAGLIAGGVPEAVAEQCASLAWGRPGRAWNLARDSQELNNLAAEIGRWQNLLGKPFHEKLAAVEELFGKKDDDPILKRARWCEILEIWEWQLRNQLRSLASITSLPNQTKQPVSYSAAQIVSIIDEITKARDLLSENINPRLVVEQLLLMF